MFNFLSTADTVDFYRKSFLGLRREIVDGLQNYSSPGVYDLAQRQSDGIKTKIVNGMRSLGLDENNCMLAFDGSLAVGVANRESDIDGVVCLRTGEGFDTESLEDKIDGLIKANGFESNIRVIDSSKPLSFMRQGVELGMLLAGDYAIGDFDAGLLVRMIDSSDRLEFIKVVLEDIYQKRLEMIINTGETHSKYLNRLSRLGREGTEGSI